MYELTINHKLQSPNVKSHWAKQYAYNKALTNKITLQLLKDKPLLKMPCDITLTRIAPRPFDSDNLVTSFKGVRDTIAEQFFPRLKRGQSDSIPGLFWHYAQETGPKKTYQIKITLEPR